MGMPHMAFNALEAQAQLLLPTFMDSSQQHPFHQEDQNTHVTHEHAGIGGGKKVRNPGGRPCIASMPTHEWWQVVNLSHHTRHSAYVENCTDASMPAAGCQTEYPNLVTNSIDCYECIVHSA